MPAAPSRSMSGVALQKLGKIGEDEVQQDHVEVRNRSSSGGFTFLSVDDYVTQLGGNRSINKILIANNGISAVKCIRSIRRWSYEMFGNERMVEFLVMATPEDLRANAEYIRMADQVVEVPGGSNNNNYANVMLIVEIAERFEVDAVWAGWGHASENPLLPDTLKHTERGIVFIGPPGKPMRALGDKIGSTIIAQSARVPTIAWNGDGITVDYSSAGCIPDSIYDQANVKTVEEAISACERVGLPVMIKASEGGGGKGIRKVTAEKDIAAAFTAVQGEIPGSPIFVMKLCPRSRHLEVQLLADAYGNAVALRGRDCSVQRRHQKIVEEGPVVAAPDDIWASMERAAVRLAKEVQYVNAGTVEYLYTDDGDKKEFFFLELNPRLQVEHPVTEMITGVNLPAAQLQVAMGIPLYRIPDIRRLYLHDPFSSSMIDFDTEPQKPPEGHVIAARITAENPDAGFKPTSGAIEELNFRSTPDVWGYFSVDSSGRVHEFADSQIGHLFAWGASRERARKNIILALKELSIRGDIRTTVEYIAKMMESDDFIKNNIDTSWLDQRIARYREFEKEETGQSALLVVTVGALVQAFKSAMARRQEFNGLLQRGQVPPLELLRQSQSIEIIYQGAKYMMTAHESGPSTFSIECNGSFVQADVRMLSDGGFLVLYDGKSHVAYLHKEAAGLRLVLDGQTSQFTNEYDPTRLTTDATGKIARYLVEDGAWVAKGTPFVEVEVMKMYMPLVVQESGTITLLMSEGANISPGDCLATVVLDDPSCVQKSKVFDGTLPAPTMNSRSKLKPHMIVRGAVNVLKSIMSGYMMPKEMEEEALTDLDALLSEESSLSRMVAPFEVEEALSALAGRIPAEVYDELLHMVSIYRENSTNTVDFDACKALEVLDSGAAGMSARNAAAYRNTCQSLRQVIQNHCGGVQSYTASVIISIVTEYLKAESFFANEDLRHDEDMITALRATYRNDLSQVFTIAQSHQKLKEKNALCLALLRRIQSKVSSSDSAGDDKRANSAISPYLTTLKKLSQLHGKSYSLVALEARQMLLNERIPSYSHRRSMVEGVLKSAASVPDSDPVLRTYKVDELVNESQPVFDLLLEMFQHPEPVLRQLAIETYVRRVYRAYVIDKLTVDISDGVLWSVFDFTASESSALTAADSSDDLSSLLTRGSLQATRASKTDLTRLSGSDSETSEWVAPIPAKTLRRGLMASMGTLKDFEHHLPKLLAVLKTAPRSTGKQPRQQAAGKVNTLHIALTGECEGEEDRLIKVIEGVLQDNTSSLEAAGIRRVTFTVSVPATRKPIDGWRNVTTYKYPSIYTFRQRLEYREDPIVRHMEAPHAYQLELKRLSNYNVRMVPTKDRSIHIYEARPKKNVAQKAGLAGPAATKKRFFVRAIVRSAERVDDAESQAALDSHPGPERMFVEALNALEIALGEAQRDGAQSSEYSNNHIFLSVIPDAVVNPAYVEAFVKILTTRYEEAIRRLNVSEVEFKINAKFKPESARIPMRLIATNPTGYVLRVEAYVEASVDPQTNQPIFTSVGEDFHTGELDGLPLTTPYPVVDPLQRLRELAARMSDTLYCYDFLELFERALLHLWKEHTKPRKHIRAVQLPRRPLHAVELVVRRKNGDTSSPWRAEESEDLELIPMTRSAGQNDVGMVAWLATMYTPEFPEKEGGRQVVIIANDITHKAGSFGTREDLVFDFASRFARERALPRVYLAANSGARIGMAEEVKEKFKVAWNDPQDPTRGFRYLYLTPEDHKAIKGSVNAELKLEQGEERYVIKDVIGSQPDLGVENLKGSGKIAGETSRAYQDIFTLTYVCGRTVGIGAYLVRLGHRCIQKESNAPILLTGYQALNKLLGREVYSSNAQLGGIKIMHNNGVSHCVVHDHMQGVQEILQWLSFVPAVRGRPMPLTDITGVDMIERDIEFVPPKTPYDPRFLLAGKTDEHDGHWISGFFDRNSFKEYLAGWAKTVVTGRARLGGCPVGVIVSEIRSAEKVTPADPASPDTQEHLQQQAGQVWFPDSAYKTATAIKDFQGEDLPLFIFANWRGFSGGQRDMFDEVLKFGSYIVDGLVTYKQPVFVYIPPHAELRGGAWVVVDPSINGEVMEMYADDRGRGGVLEPSGVIEIKYRKKDIMATAHRLDPELQRLDKQFFAETDDGQRKALQELIHRRESKLLGLYTQIATQFADLHDTPGRMQAKGVIGRVVAWRRARSFFYWRLRRRLAEFSLRDKIRKAAGLQCYKEATSIIRGWFEKDVAAGRTRFGPSQTEDGAAWRDDRCVLHWTLDEAEEVAKRVAGLGRQRVTTEVEKLAAEDPKAAVQGILSMISKLPDADRDEMLLLLRRESIFGMTGNH